MEKLALLLFFASLYGVLSDSTYYSSYYGKALSTTDVAAYTSNGTVANCTIAVAACNETEPRRIDGTCNNLNNPSYGATRTPYYRILPAEYYKPSNDVFNPRRGVDGSELPLARTVRTTIWAEGRVDDEELTSLNNHFFVYFITDVTNTRDTSNYVFWRPNCCKGSTDSACAPNYVSPNDFVHRFSGVTCLNMTRPLTFQTSGCLPNTTTPLRIVDATPVLDSSPIYGNTADVARRTLSGGKLVTVTVGKTNLPDTSKINLLLGINFFGIIFFWRNHNFIAEQLQAVNPCWTDEQLFATAREINIAYATQMFYYELAANLLGYDNLVGEGVLAEDIDNFRDVYDETVLPQISLEYPVAVRWMHTLQEGQLKMYFTNGTYNSSFPIVDLTANTNFLTQGDNMIGVTQGCFRQPTGNAKDFVVDPDIVQKGLSRLQYSNDIMTNDLAKNRYFGFPSYIKYREHYFGDSITDFEDLAGIVDEERITQLKELYKNVADVDLMAGIWVENIMEGARVPPTLYKIIVEQLLVSLKSDRHWYERETRPNAFTAEQLAEIRKATVARLLCDTGDSVTEIQEQAFLLPSFLNPIVTCPEIPAIDFSVWADSSCDDGSTTTEDYDYDYDSNSA